MRVFNTILYRKTILVLLGFFVLSSFSSDIALIFLNMPMSLPELFAIPFFFLLPKDIKKLRFNKKTLFSLLVLWILLLLMALLYGEFRLYSILGTARAYLWLFVFYSIYSTSGNKIYLEDLMYISLGSIIGWLMSSVLALRFALTMSDENEAVYGVLLSVPLFFSIVYVKKNHFLFLIGIILVLLICTTSGTRRLIFISVITLFLIGLSAILTNKRNLIRVCFFSLIITGAFVIIIPLMRDYVREASPMIYYRVFDRTEASISGNVDDSDQGRFQDIVSLFADSYKYILPPRGFVSHQAGVDKHAGDFNDLPLFELFWTYSLFGTFIILFYFGRLYLMKLRKVFHNRDDISFVIFIYGSIMILLLFIEGTFLAYPYATPITGACLGLLKKKID